MPSIHYGWLRCSQCIAAILACWLIGLPLRSDASPLSLTTDTAADVTTSSIDVEYTQSTGILTADSSTNGYSYSVLDDSDYFLTSPAFALSATLNPTNGALISGTFEISGSDAGFLGIYSGILLEGNLTTFGFPNPTTSTNVPLEFTFQITGGALTAAGGPFAGVTTGGTILHMISKTSFFAGGWPAVNFGSQNATNIGNTNSDTFPVLNLTPTPEPSTLVLLAVGMIPLVWRLRRQGHVPVPV